MVTVLYSYLALMLLVALRLGWHVVFRLDRYDWHHNKMGIWVGFALSVVLWPLLLLKPQTLINPASSFAGYGAAARDREGDRLRNAPPPCGEVIRYRQDHARFGEETFGEFLFPADTVEKVLVECLRESPHLADDDEGAMVNWVHGRDVHYNSPTDVPQRWSRFQYIADELIRAGEVHCSQCKKNFPTGALIPKDDEGRPGWNFDRLLCNQGHNLLIVEKSHILIRSD